jgi:multimeric flavodoxin WrbA
LCYIDLKILGGKQMKTLIVNGSPVNNGATAEIAKIISDYLSGISEVKILCLGDMNIQFCKGCKACYKTAQCNQVDDVKTIMNEMDAADTIVFIVPSYWADIPGQLKTFFDRSTPYCNTHVPNAMLRQGKKCYAVSLRTGTNPNECVHILESIRHYCGHMGIEYINGFYLCGIQNRNDVGTYRDEIIRNCKLWFS